MSNRLNNLTQFEDFTIDTEKKILWYRDESVELPLKELEVLCLLVEHSGELVTKDQILDTVWKDAFVEEGVLTQNIYRLRKFFRKYGIEDEIIKNVPRRGYRFLGETSEIVEEEVSIERVVIEKSLIAEYEIDDDSHELTVGDVIEVPTKQLPSAATKSFFEKHKFVFSGLVFLLSLLALGSAYWFWRSPADSGANARSVSGNLNLQRLTTSGNAFMPAISRDNKHLAYIVSEKNTYRVLLKHIETGSETVVVKPADYEIRSLNFSADSNHLYYITREPEFPESTIYQIPIYGGAKRKIMGNVRHYFSISPDGKELAFFRYDAETDQTHLMTSKIDGSDERLVSTRKPPYFYQVWQVSPAWSPDGTKLVLTAFERDTKVPGGRTRYLVELDIKTGEEKKLKHPDWARTLQAAWLKDGTGLIVSAQEQLDSSTQFWRLSYPSGKASRITNDTNHYEEFQLSFDTKAIIAANRSEYSNLFVVPVDRPDEVRKLTTETVGHDGRWGIDWTTDGKSIVFVKSKGRRDGDIWKLDVESGELQQLTFEDSSLDRHPEIKPGGKSLLFSSGRDEGRHIWQIDLDGKNLKQVTYTKPGEDYPEISEDGKWLFYTLIETGNSELWKQPLGGGEAVRILEYAGGISKVSPTDSTRLIAHYFDRFEKTNSPWKYVLFSHEQKEELSPLPIEPHNHAYEWNKNGTGVYFAERTSNQNNLRFYSISDKSVKQLTDLKNQKIVNLSVSPDGKDIAFSSGVLTSNILRIEGF